LHYVLGVDNEQHHSTGVAIDSTESIGLDGRLCVFTARQHAMQAERDIVIIHVYTTYL